jgi:hypothetical protein
VPSGDQAPFAACVTWRTPIPSIPEEIGHLLPVRPLVELPDDVGADLAGGGQDPKEIPTRRWSERVREASRFLPKTHRGRAYQRPAPDAGHATGTYMGRGTYREVESG